MTTQNYFILTESERDDVVALNTPMYQVDPRIIDATSPGVGINTNDQAANYAIGDAVAVVGKYAAPVRIVNDPAYQASAAAMVAYLLGMPSALLENETIFAPAEPV